VAPFFWCCALVRCSAALRRTLRLGEDGAAVLLVHNFYQTLGLATQ